MKQIVLFQGDSVTDCGRLSAPAGLGHGYPRNVADHFRREGRADIAVLNRGVSGDRVRNLKARWSTDCTALSPDVLTILIGINDCWRKYDSNDETPASSYEEDYREILDRAREKTSAKIILMEPFVLPFPEDRKQWRETLDPEIRIVRRLAKEYKTGLVTLDGEFAKASVAHEYTELAADGVHPTALGHRVIADAWLRAYRDL